MAFPKTFSLRLFQAIQKQADRNADGRLTREEFNAYKVSGKIPGDVGRRETRDVHDAMRIMDANFDQIAFRALKEGEMVTRDIRPTDRTIELADLQKLARFDGAGNNISLQDFSLLSGSDTSMWPNGNDDWGIPSPPPSIPEPTPSPPSPSPNISQNFLMLLMFILLLGRR